MKRKMMIPIAIAITAMLGTLMTSTIASAVGPCCLFCQKGRCNVEVDVEEVDIKGFDVECEAICIPPLRFPWECGPLKKCGKVRCVKKLVGDKKTAKVCTYDWEAIVCCPDCRSKLRGHGCCDSAGCDDGCDMSCDSVTCDTAGCCASTTTPAVNRLAVPATSPAESTSEGQVPQVIVSEVAAPEVQIALVHAIGQAKPDADGWVRVSNLSAGSLAAEGELLESVGSLGD